MTATERLGMDENSLGERIEQCLTVSLKFTTGKPGRDFLRVDNDWEGYSSTSLETEFDLCLSKMVETLKIAPSLLDGIILRQLFEVIFNSQAAVDGYRARMLSAAGDYDNTASPVCYSLDTFMENLKSLLLELEAEQKYPLKQLEDHLLVRKVKYHTYDHSVLSHELYKLITTQEMRSAQHLYTAESEQTLHEMQNLISRLESGSKQEKLMSVDRLERLRWKLPRTYWPQFSKAFIRLLSNNSPEVIRAAGDALVKIGAEALGEIEASFEAQQAAEFRTSLLQIALRISHKAMYDTSCRVLKLLLKSLRDQAKAVRNAAETALQQFRVDDPTYVGILLEALAAQDQSTRDIAHRMLLPVRHDMKRVFAHPRAFLGNYLLHENQRVRDMANSMLEWID